MSAKVYSYARFSTPSQALGDSERRQMEQTRAYAKKHGLKFDERLTMFDRGKSAYKGKHRTKGALGSFYRAVESGTIRRGDRLVVESIDRLTREPPAEALHQLSGVLKRGILIVTLTPETEYDDQNDYKLYSLLAEIQRAHGESSVKSERVRAASNARLAKARNGEPVRLVARAPQWLQWDSDKRKFVAISKAAAAVRLAFDMRASGIGPERIAKQLNERSGVWRPPTGWHKAWLDTLLKDRAVLGEFQPRTASVRDDGRRTWVPNGDPLVGYFPEVVPKALWNRVQSVRARNIAQGDGRGGGRQSVVANVFGPLLRCSECGRALRHRKVRNEYVRCHAALDGSRCSERPVRYDHLELTLLHFVKGLDPKALLAPDETAAARASALHELQAVEGDIGQRRSQADNITDQISRTSDARVRDAYERKLAGLFADIESLEKRRDALAQQQQSNGSKAIAEQIRSVEQFVEQMSKLKGDDRVELRLRLRAQLQQLIESIKVRVLKSGTALEIAFRDGARVALKLDDKGVLRLAHGARIVAVDEHGDVHVVDDEDVKGGESGEQRQKRVDAMIRAAIKRKSVRVQKPQLIARSRRR
jgi:hypothetical protein